MADRPPFDTVKWSFYLVAFVIVVHAVIALAGVGLCVYYGLTIVSNNETLCDPKGRLGDLLAGALAAALAFAGGFMRNRPPDDKDPPSKS